MTAALAQTDRSLTRRFRAMNTDVTIEVIDPTAQAQEAITAAQEVFATVEGSCTRFDPHSALMRANEAGRSWTPVPLECFAAISEAAHAHEETGGLFDPRVLTALVELGYDRTLPFGSGPVDVSTGTRPTDLPATLTTGWHAPAGQPAGSSGDPYGGQPDGGIDGWQPGLDVDQWAVQIGDRPIDLGGIGKGLAVRWAAMSLAGCGSSFLVEAGGDCALGGYGPDSIGWKVGVEDPHGGDTPVAVLQLANTSCATSSLRKRSWTRDGRQHHHLIDPRTGRSAETGLRSVTVVDPDPARAEVWSKSLLIAGRGEIGRLAAERDLPVLWVGDDGHLGASDQLLSRLIWTARDVD